MALSGILRWIAVGSSHGPFGWIVDIYREKARTKRAEKWQAHAAALASSLRDGAVIEERTSEGSLRIWAPPVQATHFSVRLTQQELECDPPGPPEVQALLPKELGQEDVPPIDDPFAGSGD